MYIQRVRIYPQLGKVREMGQHLESWVQTRQGQGAKIGLSLQAFAPEGVVFVITISLQDLAELEQLRVRNRADPAFMASQAKIQELSRQHPTIELLEVLVPLAR